MRKHVIDYDYYANQYALKIISGVRGYTLIKALEIFKDKFYLVRERYIKYTSAINAVRQYVKFKAVTKNPRVYQSLREMGKDIAEIVRYNEYLIKGILSLKVALDYVPDEVIKERERHRAVHNSIKKDLDLYNNTLSTIEDIILNNKITLTSYYLELESLMDSNIKQLLKDMRTLDSLDTNLIVSHVAIKGE